MQNIRTTQNTLTDGSLTHAVKFEAINPANGLTTVTIECDDEESADLMASTLRHMGSFAYVDPVQ